MKAHDSQEQAESQRRPLSRHERIALIVISLLSIAVAASALLKAVGGSLTFFGEQVTPRNATIAGQAFRTVVWAIATPFCARVVLRRGLRGWLGVAAWLALLLWSAWWQWPPHPTGSFDSEDPIWLSSFALLWALVAFGAGVGLYAAWRSGRSLSRAAAVLLVAATVGVGAASHVNLVRNKNTERAAPLAEGALELRALRSDPIWTALPAGVRRVERERPARRAVWGELFATSMTVELGTFDDHELFRAAVAAAERSDWVLVSTYCYQRSWDARLQKTLPAGQARLRISVAPYLRAVHVFAEMTPETSPGDPRKCWGDESPARSD